MKTYIPKQPKHLRERIEAKLDERLVRKLERYCQYVDSDRDYVVGQALEIAFRKDRGFAQWLASQDATAAHVEIDTAPDGRSQGRGASGGAETLEALTVGNKVPR